MAKKVGAKALPRIDDCTGWILVSSDEDTGWGIAWGEIFYRKHEALRFAEQNKWPKPYRAVRGKLTVDQQ